MNLVEKLTAAGIAKPPRWLPANVHYLTRMGSEAYGCAVDDSDCDIYGFCIPKKEDVFPHLKGEIVGFGRQTQRFEQWQEHHLFDQSANGGKGQEYDFSVYSIVKYFSLCMENNPNMVDSLFTDRTMVVHSTPIAEMVRERRRSFLHKGAWHKFKGYAYSQLSKIDSQSDRTEAIRAFEAANRIPHEANYEMIESIDTGGKVYVFPSLLVLAGDREKWAEYKRLWRDGIEGTKDRKGSKRFASRKRLGYDAKFATHLVRLVQEVEQILLNGDIDLRRDAELLKDVRGGKWTEKQVREWFHRRETEIEPLYLSSKAIPHKPDETAVKTLLLECLEHHYGKLDHCPVDEAKAIATLRQVAAIIQEAGV